MRWYGGSIVEAVNLSKSRNAIFVVYVEGNDAQSKEMTELIDSPEVSSRLEVEDNFVAIKLVSGTEAYTQFAQIYQLVPVPSIFFIGTSGAPLEVVAGSTAGGISGLSSRIDTLTANKGGKAPHPVQLSQPSTSVSTARSSTSAFLASEQGAIPKTTAKKDIDVKVPDVVKQTPSASDEYDLVCEGEVCVRRPRQPSPVTDKGDTLESTTGTSAETPSPIPAEPALPAAVEPRVETQEDGKDGTDKTESELSLQEKRERALELIEKQRKEKLEEERRLEREKELERRAQGAGVAELKRWQQEQELKTLKEERLRDKKDNEMRRARILEDIAQDRVNQQSRFGKPTDVPKPASPSTASAPSPVADTSKITRIQFKLADSSTHTTQISSDATLADLRRYVRENIESTGNFSLSTVYPRRCLTPQEDSRTMRELELSPASALLLLRGDPGSLPSQIEKSSTGFISMLTQIFWSFIVNPASDLFRYVSNMITGQRARGRSSPDATPAVVPEPRTQTARRPPQQEDSAVKRRRVGGETSGVSTVRREGNTYRLKDRDSDDENNTWNGNSTQQM